MADTRVIQMQALGSACEALRLADVADSLAVLSVQTQQDLPSLLALLCPALCRALFPRSVVPCASSQANRLAKSMVQKAGICH